MYQKFNPGNWLSDDNRSDIEQVVSRIESAHTDITGSYSDWRNIGFALADERAESGRDYFHRISRFYPKYSHSDCDKQYDQCLKSQGHGITIKTLFHRAKMAGIEIGGAAVFNQGCSEDVKERADGLFALLENQAWVPSAIPDNKFDHVFI